MNRKLSRICFSVFDFGAEGKKVQLAGRLNVYVVFSLQTWDGYLKKLPLNFEKQQCPCKPQVLLSVQLRLQ